MYHIVLSQAVDLVSIDRAAQADRCPRHVVSDISQRLGATVHQPGSDVITPIDCIGAKIIGQPAHWALARRLSCQLTNDDTVFCLGEDVGFALAILCKVKGKLPKLAVSVMDPERTRVYGVLKMFRLDEQIERFLTHTHIGTQAIRAYMYLPHDRVCQVPEPIDTKFFCPAAVQPATRPTIVSVSCEPHDYQTLANATQSLDVEVKVGAVSLTGAAPPPIHMPRVTSTNMTAASYDELALLQLYRQASVVVVSLPDHHASAELTPLMAALACRRPVIVTRTPGLAEELINLEAVMGVNPGDASGLQQAITHLLDYPHLAATQAQAGYEHILNEHTSESYIEQVIHQLQNLDGLLQPEYQNMLFSPDASITG